MKVNEMKINRIIEYIVFCGDSYPFDVMDTMECVQDILDYYCIDEYLNPAELEAVRDELLPLANIFQTKEIQQTLQDCKDIVLNVIPENNSRFNAKLEAIERKALLASIES